MKPLMKNEGMAKLTWDPMERADGYRVSLDGGKTWQVTWDREVDVEPGKHYEFLIQGISDSGHSGFAAPEVLGR